MNSSSSTLLAVAWLAYLGMVVYLAQILGVLVIPVAAIAMPPLIVMMNLIMKGERRASMSMTDMASDSEKRKRKRIDAMIRDMSDDELYELRQRLQEGDYDEDYIYDRVVGDDGELMRR